MRLLPLSLSARFGARHSRRRAASADWRHGTLLLILAAVPALLAASPAPRATPKPAAPNVILSANPDGDPGDLIVTVPSTATGTSISVFLRNTSLAALSPFRILASATTRQPDDAMANESTVSIAFPDASGGVVTLGPKVELAGVVTVEGLTTPGVYNARVFLQQPGIDAALLTTIKITKAAKLDVTLEGANADGLVASERSSTFARSLALISGSTQAASVSVSLGQVLGPDGQQVAGATLTVDGKQPPGPFRLDALGRLALRFEIPTALAGEYVSSLEVVSLPDRVLVPIKITRERLAAEVTTDGPFAAPATLAQPGSSGTTQVLVRVTGAGGTPVTITPPTLVLYRDEAGSKLLASAALSAATTQEGGSAIASPQPFAGPVAVAADGSVQVEGTITDIDEPGTYHGTLTMGVVDGKPITGDFSFTARRSILIATILIMLGIVLAWAVRWLATSGLPRAKAKSRLRAAADTAARQSRRQNLPPYARYIIDDIRARVVDAVAHLAVEVGEATTAEIEALEAQLRAFDTLVRAEREAERRPIGAELTTRLHDLREAMVRRVLDGTATAALGEASALVTAILAVPEPDAVELADLTPEPGALPSPVVLALTTRALTFALWLLLVAAGTLIGLSALWMSNQTWGSAVDLLAALLWGAGLWAASGQPFGGIDSLGRTLSGKA